MQFSYLGLESCKSSAAGGGVEGFACILQAGSALLPLRLQGVFTLLLCLLQLLSHLLSQLGCPLVVETLTLNILSLFSCLFFFLGERFESLVLPSSYHCCVEVTSWGVRASARSSTSPPSSVLPHTELSSPPHPQVSPHPWTTLRETRRRKWVRCFFTYTTTFFSKFSKKSWLNYFNIMHNALNKMNNNNQNSCL